MPIPQSVLDLIERFFRNIDATDRQIDRLVYTLYELTDEEIRIVERGGARNPGNVIQ